MNLIARVLLVLLSGFILFSAAPALAASQTTNDVFAACQQAPTSPACAGKNTETNPAYHTIRVTANIVALLTGFAAVVVIIVSGISLIGSAGNPEAVTNSRRRIAAAVIGLLVVSLAWVIISYVISKLIKT